MIEKVKRNTFITALLVFLIIVSPIVIVIYNVLINDQSYTFWYGYIVVVGLLSLVNGIINYLFVKNKKDYVILLLIGSLLMAFLAMLFSGNIQQSFWGSIFRHSGFLSYLCFFGYFLNAIFLNKKYYKKIGVIFLIITVFICIITLMNNNITYRLFYYHDYPKTARINYPYHAIYYNANHLGYYLTFSTIISIFMFFQERTWKKIFYLISYEVILYTIIINNTFGSYLGILFMLPLVGIYAIKNKKKMDCLVVIILFIVNSMFISFHDFYVVKSNFDGLLTSTVETGKKQISDDAGTGRIGVWKKLISYIKESPILGYGGENMNQKYLDEHISPRSPHNIILEIMAYNGIPCAIMYFGALLIIVWRYFKKKLFHNVATCLLLSCGSYFISSLFGNITFYISPYFVILLGLLFGVESGFYEKNS